MKKILYLSCSLATLIFVLFVSNNYLNYKRGETEKVLEVDEDGLTRKLFLNKKDNSKYAHLPKIQTVPEDSGINKIGDELTIVSDDEILKKAKIVAKEHLDIDIKKKAIIAHLPEYTVVFWPIVREKKYPGSSVYGLSLIHI